MLAGKIVERYAQHPAIEMWHINNEYGCHVSHCYCDVSAKAFRTWLEAKYGSIELLNEAWGTAFWSQQYQQFAEVYPPSAAPSPAFKDEPAGRRKPFAELSSTRKPSPMNDPSPNAYNTLNPPPPAPVTRVWLPWTITLVSVAVDCVADASLACPIKPAL